MSSPIRSDFREADMESSKRRRSSSPSEQAAKRQRQSFLSPTRASLSRHNPSILSRRLQEQQAQQSNIRLQRHGSLQPVSRPAADTAALTTRASQPEPNTSLLPNVGSRVSSPARSIGGGLAEPPQRSPVAFHQPLRRHPNDAIKKPFKGRTLRRSPPLGTRSPAPTAQPLPEEPPQDDASQEEEEVSPNEQMIMDLDRDPFQLPLSETMLQPQASAPYEPSGSAEDEPSDSGDTHSEARELLETLEEAAAREEPQPNEPVPPDDKNDKPEQDTDLPPTTAERGIPDPIVTAPPTGIHKVSPSKKWPNPMKPSPLRPPPLTSIDPNQRNSSKQKAGSATIPLKRKRDDPDPIRGVPPVDANEGAIRIRDKLKAQIGVVERDIQLAARSNSRIQAYQRGDRDFSSTEKAALFGLLKRWELPPEEQDDPEEKEKRQNAALQDVLKSVLGPVGVLPFKNSAMNIPPHSIKQGSTDTGRGSGTGELPTHLPVQMTEEEALPFLRAFTPLEFQSRITMLPQQHGRPLVQKHEMCVSSPDGLFSALVIMHVDTLVPAVSSLSVPLLEQSARAELGPFIASLTATQEGRERESTTARTTKTTTSVRNNVSVLGWAMGEWYRISVRRAKMWAALQRELGTAQKVIEAVDRLRRSGGKRRKKKEKKKGDDEAEGEDNEEDDYESSLRKNHVGNKHDILEHLGRRSMEFAVPLPRGGDEASLRLEWEIRFDWTGEARSKLGILVGMPGRWRHVDPSALPSSSPSSSFSSSPAPSNADAVAGLEEMFASFLDGEVDLPAAVRTVVALLGGDLRFGTDH